MIRRTHSESGTESAADYSDCGRYRYALRRTWAGGPRLLWVMLNPSTATEAANDPTVARCEGRSRALGFAGFAVANLYGFRATRPADLFAVADPVGPGNDATVLAEAVQADAILCAWGVHGLRGGRGETVAAMLRETGRPLWHLGLTRGGAPRHPLYVAAAVEPARFGEPA